MTGVYCVYYRGCRASEQEGRTTQEGGHLDIKCLSVCVCVDVVWVSSGFLFGFPGCFF